jgi:hypothetical protein
MCRQAHPSSSYNLADFDMLDPGTRLGSYEILAALATGGMGEVYRQRI